MAKGKFVVLNHKSKIYKGEEYHSFTGAIKVGGKNILLSINSDADGNIEVREGEYKGRPTRGIFVNLHEFKAVSNGGKRRNEF